MTNLPKELWTIIILKCRIMDWSNIVLSCKMFNEIIHDPFFQNNWYPIKDDGQPLPIKSILKFRNKIIVMFGNDNNRYKISAMKSRYRFETSNNFKIWPMHIIHICKLRLAKDIPQYLIIGKYLYSNEICKFISHVYRETIIIK